MTPSLAPLLQFFQRLLDFYEQALVKRRDTCVKEYRGYALTVFDHLIKKTPTVRLVRRQLAPYLHPDSGPIWARYPRDLNLVLLDFARAKKVKVRAHHITIKRHGKRPTRRTNAVPVPYDWPWQRRDFTSRAVKAQWWEADLAHRYEVHVLAPTRRAIRALAMARTFLADYVAIEDPLLDLDHAENWIRERLDLKPATPGSPTPPLALPHFQAPEPPALEDPFEARRRTISLLLEAAGTSLRVCADQYSAAAHQLWWRLSQAVDHPLQQPRLELRYATDDRLEEPILIWFGAASHRHKHKPLPWSNRTALRQYQAYLARSRAKGHDPLAMAHYLFVTEASRPKRDFNVAPEWERHFAHYYDRHIVAPLQRQWVRLWQIRWLTLSMMDPATFTIKFDPDDYLPDAEARKEQQARDRKPWT